ncbi:MAG: response regulator [Candidatus Marinimicrobia bacterium]|nr:response regulator [Candidatus Neomarinimicrobiota bacterium]
MNHTDSQSISTINNNKISPREILNYLTDIILLCDPDYTISISNRSADFIYGTGETVTGLKCYEVIRGKSSPCEDCPLQETITDKRLIPIENYDERIGKYMEEKTHPIIDPSEGLQGFVLVSKNVTHDREIKDRSVQTKKLSAIGRISAGVAHDFNNLLQVVLGRVKLLEKLVKDDHIIEQLRIIESAANSGAATVKKMQEFTRISKDDHLVSVNISKLIKDAVELTSHELKEFSERNGILIQIVEKIDPDLYIKGNKNDLQNAVTNIIFNAVDAMPDGGVLFIKVFLVDDKVTLSFVDTGIGMTEETKERIFDPFYSTKGVKGNGLGMSEVYGIVNRAQGNVSVKSEQGKGSLILMDFPQTLDTFQEKENAEPIQEGVYKILIVDDEQYVLDVIEDLLTDLGHEVHGFTSASKALMALNNSKFDLVITDLGMQEMTGKEVAEKVKKISSQIPVVLLSGWHVDLQKDPELRNLVDFSITKPFQIEVIQQTINKAVNKYKSPK